MLLEHLLQLLCIKRARTIIIKLEEDILDVILSLQLTFSLHIKVLRLGRVAGLKPVLRCHTSH